MPAQGWYLHAKAADVGDRAVLVGDPGRARRVAARLDEVAWLNEDRNLVTATGGYGGQRITVSAFGMGAPVAVVVLHELRALGVHTFLRLGTVMCLPPARLGQLVLADAALRGEATSAAYVPDGYPAAGDTELGRLLRGRLVACSRPWIAGLVASYDGFYTDMLAIDAGLRDRVDARRAELERVGVVALDMETSAVLAVGRALGARAASLCLASVDAGSARRLDGPDRESAEDDLVEVGLDALARVAGPPDTPGEEPP
jgi:uridine phosphorylase